MIPIVKSRKSSPSAERDGKERRHRSGSHAGNTASVVQTMLILICMAILGGLIRMQLLRFVEGVLPGIAI